MPTEEQQKAAERLRKDDYDPNAYTEGYSSIIVCPQQLEDLKILYRAEHPPDDHKLVTEEFFCSVGHAGKHITVIHKCRPVMAKTWGQYRRLCAALGVELKETDDE